MSWQVSWIMGNACILSHVARRWRSRWLLLFDWHLVLYSVLKLFLHLSDFDYIFETFAQVSMCVHIYTIVDNYRPIFVNVCVAILIWVILIHHHLRTLCTGSLSIWWGLEEDTRRDKNAGLRQPQELAVKNEWFVAYPQIGVWIILIKPSKI